MTGTRRVTSTRRPPLPPLRAYWRLRNVVFEGAKFGIVGLTGVLVTNIVYTPLHNQLRLGVVTSNAIATLVAIVVTYLGNRYWSFKGRKGSGTGREGAMFVVLNLIGMAIQLVVVAVAAHVLGLTSKLEEYVALNLGIGLGTVFRWWSYRKFIWVPYEVHLARMRRGRHRIGRPIIDPADLGYGRAGRPGSMAAAASSPDHPSRRWS